MTTSFSLKKGSLFLLLSVGFVLVGCKTAPETPSKPQTSQPADAKEDSASSLLQEEIDAARAAVRRANLAGANQYFPSEFRDLATALNYGIGLGKTDDTAARVALKRVVADADALYEKTIAARWEKYGTQYAKADKALLSLEANRFTPDLYKEIQAMSDTVVDAYKKGDFADFQKKADETLTKQARLYYNLNENLRLVNILKRDAEIYLGDAEDNEAFLYAEDDLRKANQYLSDGMDALKNYNLEDSVRNLANAKRQAILTARISDVRKKQAATDALMLETQNRLEAASRIQALTPEGSDNGAEVWDGNQYLSKNPLVDHSKNVKPVDVEEPPLRAFDAPTEDGSDDFDFSVPADVPIEGDGTQVNGDEEKVDALKLAESLWTKGVDARNNQDFDLAQDYFRQAQAYLDVYESNSVTKTYTVVYRKVKTDCLWRIAAQEDIYGDPFLWPKIWRANRRIIQNPDLIYPGQVLVIPPK